MVERKRVNKNNTSAKMKFCVRMQNSIPHLILVADSSLIRTVENEKESCQEKVQLHHLSTAEAQSTNENEASHWFQ